MKQSSVAALIGTMILLIGIEILLIYIACTTQANEGITFQYKDVIKKKTTVSANTTTSTTMSTTVKTTVITTLSSITMPSENSTGATTTSEYTTESSTRTSATASSTKLTSPSEKTTTTDGITTMPSTQFKMTSMQSTTLSTRCGTQECVTSPTHSSSSKRTSSTTTDAIETTTNIAETTLITTTPSTIATTFATNPTILTTTASEIPNITSTPSFIPPITTTAASETNVTGKSSTFIITTTTPMPPPTPVPPPTVPFPSVTEITTTETSLASTDCDTYVTANTTTEITTKKDTSYRTRITIPKFNYVLRDAAKGVECVLANMTIHINLQYATKGSEVLKPMLTVPVDARTTGTCNEKTANMILSWEEPAKNQVCSNNSENKITFNYAHDNTKFFLDSIFVDVHLNDKRMKRNTTDRRLQLFSTALNNGIFICKMGTTINVGNRIYVDISDIYLIVFNKCFDNCTKIGTNCIFKTRIKIIAIIGTIIIGILLFIILFVSYLMWYTERKGISQDFNTLPGITLQ